MSSSSAVRELDLGLARFRASRGGAVGRPLYGWRCSDAEYEALGASLREALEGSASWSEPRWCQRALCAGFVLYGAEWWRREYGGGGWEWAPLFGSLGAVPPSPLVYQRMVREGLVAWGRWVVRPGATSRYLGTLALEGGLPLRALGAGGVTRHLEAVMRAYARYGASVSAVELAREHAALLPQVYRRNPEFMALVGEVVERVAAWQGLLPGVGDPVEELAVALPSWQEELPLRVDDEAARRLLRGLFTEAREGGRASASSSVPALSVVLEEGIGGGGGGFVVRRALELPGALSASEVAGWLGVEPGGAPVLSLVAGAAGQEQALVARAELRGSGEQARYVFSARQGAQALSAWPVEASVWLQVYGVGQGAPVEVPLLGGEGLGEGAWVFGPSRRREEEEEGTWALLWQGGGGRTRWPEARVVVPGGVELEGDACAVGELVGGARAVWWCEGEARWGAEVLRTGEAKAPEAARLELRGALLAGFGALEPVFAGVPRLRVVEEGGPVRVSEASLRWRGSWSRGEARRVSEAWGEGWLEVEGRSGGVRCKVAPAGASLVLRPEPAAGRYAGVIEARGFGAQAVGAEGEGVEVVEAAREPGADVWRVRVRSESAPPRSVALWLKDGQGRELRVQVRYPAARGSFATTQRRVAPGERLHPDRLSTLRAELVEGSRSLGHCAVVARVEGREEASLPLRVEGEGVLGASLDALRGEVRRLLARSWAVDAEVELRLDGAPHEARLVVARFEGYVREVGGVDERASVVERGGVARFGVSLAEHVLAPPGHDAQVRLEAVSLRDVAQRVELAREGDTWVLDTAALEPGPWLVFGQEGRMYRFRPKLLRVAGAVEAAQGAMEQAVCEIDPERRERLLQAWAEALAADALHPDWERALAVLRTVEDIPPVCFDVCQVFARTPAALALALVKLHGAEGPEAVWRLRRGMLRMPWHDALLTLDAWRAAARALEAAWTTTQAQLPEAGATLDLRRMMVLEPLAQLAATFGDAAPALRVLVELAQHEVLGAPTPREVALAQQLPMHIAEQIHQLHKELTRRHIDARWPAWEALEERGRPVLSDLAARLQRDVLAKLRQEPCATDPRTGEPLHPHRKPALLAPLLAAALALSDDPPSADDLAALRRMEAFAPDLFQQLFALGVTLFWAGSPTVTTLRIRK